MTGLPDPLAEALRDPFSERELDALWRSVRARRASRHAPSRRAAMGLACAAAMAAIVAWATRRTPPALDEGPLRLEGGGVLRAIDAGGARAVRLSDGSEITLAAGAGLRATANDGRRFEATLTGGRGLFEVRPGGPRRWRVDCGGLAVEVLGTGFEIARSDDEIRVTVRHGVVRVTGAGVAGGARQLRAGEWIAVALGTTNDGQVVARAPQPVAETPPRAAEAPRRATRREPTEDALWEQANQARLAHRYDDATRALESLARRFPSQRATATYKLGQIEMDDLGRHARAAAVFERALASGLPLALREDGYVRWVQSLSRSNRPDAARRAAEAYLREFPQGRRRGDVARWAPAP